MVDTLASKVASLRGSLVKQLRDDERSSPLAFGGARTAIQRRRLERLRKTRVEAVANVTLQMACDQIRRLWDARAATLYVYNCYQSTIVGAKSLQRVPTDTLLFWAEEMRADFAPLLRGPQPSMDAHDLLAPIAQTLVLQANSQRMASMQTEFDAQMDADKNADAVSATVFVHHLAYMSSTCVMLSGGDVSTPPAAETLGGNDCNEAMRRLWSLWQFYWFRRFQSHDVPITRNPAALTTLRARWAETDHDAYRQALVQLQQYLRQLTARDDTIFTSSLVAIWCQRIDEMRKGLETAHFMHRMFNRGDLSCDCGDEACVIESINRYPDPSDNEDDNAGHDTVSECDPPSDDNDDEASKRLLVCSTRADGECVEKKGDARYVMDDDRAVVTSVSGGVWM